MSLAHQVVREQPEVARAVEVYARVLLRQIAARDGRWPDPISLPAPVTRAQRDGLRVFQQTLEAGIGRPVRIVLQ